MLFGLSRTVVVLGIVSFLTDVSSEMIYPLLPAFLSTVLGAGALQLGIIEGVAEATASLMKLFSGLWTDHTGKRKSLVVAGYSLSGLARPLVGLATIWPWVLALRFFDRIGKGIRTSPRDALIADTTDSKIRGRAYGFHRAMDHGGAVCGPLLASLLMASFGFSMREVFLWAMVPSLIVIAILVFGLRESAQKPVVEKPVTSLSGFKTLSPEFRRFLLAMFLFSLGNATDAFLLLKLSVSGVSGPQIPLLWALFHVVKMVSNFFGGRISDRVGPKPMLLAGWLLYVAVYAGFALTDSRNEMIALFLIYGIFYGCTEPSEKAYVSGLVDAGRRGTAFGWFHFTIGLSALPASIVFGLVWQQVGAPAAFCLGAGLAAVASAILLFSKRGTRLKTS